MNTQKYKVATQCGLLAEADRSLYKDKNGNYKDTVSRSNIDFTKSDMNYNLCPHPQYSQKQIKEYIEKITHKTMRKDAVWGSTIITIPKDYDGDVRTFFEAAYDGLKEIYNITDDDIISSWVHVQDEASSHMHLYYIPRYREQGKEGVSWSKVMPREMYRKQHQMLEQYINQQPYFIKHKVRLLNGATLGIGDINKLSRADKIAHQQRLEQQEQELQAKLKEFIKTQYKPLQLRCNELEHRCKTLQELYSKLLGWIELKLPTINKIAKKEKKYEIASDKVKNMTEAMLKSELGKASVIDKSLDRIWDDFKEDYREQIKSL